MGRYSTGAEHVMETQRLELSILRKRLFFECFGKNFEKYGYHKQVISWSNGSKIDIYTCNKKSGLYLILSYTITNRFGEQTYMKYKVQIERKPSNLGAGEVLYFRCPVSNNLCRILYRAYRSDHFKSRKAYKHRLYYPVQMVSRKYLLLERSDNAKDKYYKLPPIRKQTTFKGEPTKREIRKNTLYYKYIELADMADMSFINIFLKR